MSLMEMDRMTDEEIRRYLERMDKEEDTDEDSKGRTSQN